MHSRVLVVSCFCFVSFLASAIGADTLVVTQTPGGGYPSIRAAVYDAKDGDVVLVKTGLYSGFAITNKSLTVVADTGQVVTITGPIKIEGLSSEKHVSLIGLRSSSAFGNPPGPLTAKNNHGSIRVFDSTFVGFSSRVGGLLGAGVTLFDSRNVAFTNCVIQGGLGSQGGDEGGSGGPGIYSRASLSAIYNSSVSGGHGTSGSQSYGSGGDGGTALDIGAGLSFASGSEFIGGDGGFTDDFLCGKGGDAGHAISTTALSTVHVLDTQLAAGEAGIGSVCPSGAAGLRFAGTGQFFKYAFDARSIQMPVPVRAGTTQQLDLLGQPGDLAFIQYSHAPSFRIDPEYTGVLLLDSDLLLYQGVIPASGKLTKTLTFNALSPGVPSLQFQVQSVFLDTSQSFIVGSNAEIIVLNFDL